MKVLYIYIYVYTCIFMHTYIHMNTQTVINSARSTHTDRSNLEGSARAWHAHIQGHESIRNRYDHAFTRAQQVLKN